MKQALGGSVNGEADILKLAGITLAEDEKMISFARIHGAIYWKAVGVLIFALWLALGVTVTLGMFFLFVGGVMLVLAHLARHFLVLAATNKRIFVRSGFFYADMIELRYAQVESIELGIMPSGQVFGYGSVILTGTGQRRIIVPFVANAIQFRSKVNEILVNK